MKNRTLASFFIAGIAVASILVSPFILDPTLVPRYFGLSLCFATLFYILYRQHFSLHIKADGLLILYAGYTIFCCLSILWATTKSESLFESTKQILGFLVFLFTCYALKTEKDYFFEMLSKLSLILFVFVFTVIVYQVSGIPDLGKESLYQVNGLHGHKNLLSSFLFLNLFFLLRTFTKTEKPLKIASGICILFSIIILCILRTKAVWLGLATALLVFLILYSLPFRIKNVVPKTKSILLILLTVFVLNIFFLGFLQPLIHKSINYTALLTSSPDNLLNPIKLEQERLVLWDKTFHQIRQNPLLGVGMGNWQIHLPDATLSGLGRGEDLNYTFQRPHNDFLWILSETGIIGFNMFLLFIVSLIFLLFKTAGTGSEDQAIRVDQSLCAAFICGYFMISFFDFPKERIEHTVWINIILAIAYLYVRVAFPFKKNITFRLTKEMAMLGFILCLFIALTGYKRLAGEFFTRKMYDAKNSNQLLKLVEAGKSARSFAYSIDPTSVPISWYTGNANASSGKYAEAQSDFLEAYALNPFNRNVLNDLASSYVFTNNVLLAKTYYEESARISPRFDDPKLNLAAIYINAGDYKTADYWLKSLLHDSERRAKYQKIIELNKK